MFGWISWDIIVISLSNSIFSLSDSCRLMVLTATVNPDRFSVPLYILPNWPNMHRVKPDIGKHNLLTYSIYTTSGT